MPTITQLPTATSVTPDDLVLLVNAPGGSPSTQRARVSDIVALASSTLADTTWKGTWSSGTTYAAGDVVARNGNTYVSLVGSNLNQDPTTEDEDWQLWVAQGPEGDPGPTGTGTAGPAGLPSSWDANVWNGANTYALGTAVRHNTDGASYVAVVNSATSDPSTDHAPGGSWRKISDRGFRGVKPFNTVEVWETATAYSEGDANTPADAVFHTDSSYVCIDSHTSGTFATDLAANKWQQIAAPGGVSSVSGTGPIVIDNTNPTEPVVEITQDEADGVPVLDGDGIVRRSQLPVRQVQFRHATQDIGVTGDLGGSDGQTGGTSASNNSFSTKVELARVYVNGDPSSTGGYVYQRVDELEATLTINMDMSDSEHVALYLAWVRVSDSYRVHPTYITPHAIADGVSTDGLVTAHVRATAPPIPAQNNESYKLFAWVKNNGGFIYDATADGQYDIVTARSYAVET